MFSGCPDGFQGKRSASPGGRRFLGHLMMGMPSERHLPLSGSDLRAGFGKSFAGGVGLEFLEVVDEHLGEFPGLFVPFLRICVCIARVEDPGVYSGKFGGNREVEVGDHLCGSLVDGSVEDVVDDTAGVTYGDALAGTVPSCIDQICPGAAQFHLLHQFLGVFCGMEREERLAETCRECRGCRALFRRVWR